MSILPSEVARERVDADEGGGLFLWLFTRGRLGLALFPLPSSHGACDLIKGPAGVGWDIGIGSDTYDDEEDGPPSLLSCKMEGAGDDATD